MINLVKGDLFDSGADIIAHGCNCQGGFGSGVAKIVATKYPKARARYLEKHANEGWELGEVQFVKLSSGEHYIANCATQDAYLPRGICHADYDGIRIAMMTVKEFAKDKGLSIALPKIGAGLAGGDWNTIETILKEVFSDYDATVYYLE
jgi:O-acetyl-ADP-ribose deacetylase (regulator of RNase III)